MEGRRIAHYVSVHFPDGQVAGWEVALSKKDHARVIGWSSQQRYSESLGYFRRQLFTVTGRSESRPCKRYRPAQSQQECPRPP